jgi:hypothetical protein
MFSRVPQDRQAFPFEWEIRFAWAADVNFLQPLCHSRPQHRVPATRGRVGRMSRAEAFILPGNGYHCPWLDPGPYPNRSPASALGLHSTTSPENIEHDTVKDE